VNQVFNEEKKLRWGILGAGNIAKSFVKGVKHSKYGVVVAVGSRSLEKANAFGEEFQIAKRHGSYEALLKDPEVDAVYIATPHTNHAELSVLAAEAGKHILCEKPAGINAWEMMTIVESARRNNVFFMEAFMYRCHPQTHRLVELLREKTIGDVRLIHASFSFHSKYNPESRLFNHSLAGGGILDVGGYPMSMARLIAGAALGKESAEPKKIKAVGVIGKESRCDEWTSATLEFDGDILAQISTGISLSQDNQVKIFGTLGQITVLTPWIPSKESGSTTILVKLNSSPEVTEIKIETAEWLYGIEADTAAQAISQKQASFPAMNWNDSIGNALALDAWRAEIGLIYDREKPEASLAPIHGRQLQVRNEKIPKVKIKGLDKKVSRLAMGVDNQKVFGQAAMVFDDFYELGGNVFDTAYIYGGGACETVLGQWVKQRKVREQVAIIVKGAHTPFCDPKSLSEQLLKSLERLQTSYADIYMMHRDNLDIPVSEFVDVLNEHHRAGRIKVFGGSNWSLARVQEANEYAKKKGLVGFSVLSNNLSLARMVNPVWGGCISVADKESRTWLTKNEITLLPWSSQARGFFVPERAHPSKQEDQSLVHSWYSEDNFERQKRAIELSARYELEPVNIALAYVLCQPFAALPLIGPRFLSETISSTAAFDVVLSSEEMAWLNLETDELDFGKIKFDKVKKKVLV
jgi:predicted dehydrogenase/aryl-alcohol dehydrogenase-like predicted oxidoreductase